LSGGRAGLAALAPLFLVSAAAVGFEIALTRYFAVAKWSEYGYWIISIVLAGFALSGVAMALARGWLGARGDGLIAFLPAALVVAAAAGQHLVAANPFNPLQLQNQATIADQLWNIAGYYAALLPFFFLAGLFVSLSFVRNPTDIGRVYGFDLTGAGAGSIGVLALMALVPPFRLVACLLPALAAASAFAPVRRRAALLAALAALAGGEALLLLDDPASFNDAKAIYAPLHVPDSRTVAELRSPRGWYLLLDDFTERVDTDVSNDAGQLGLPGPPPGLGLYRDGNRLATLPKAPPDAGYAPATLAALPYGLLHAPFVLLAGSSGGWRIAEARALGAAAVEALEPEPVLRAALRHGIGPSPALPPAAWLRIGAESPLAAARAGARYDLIDISADFLDAGEANTSAFTAEAVAAYLGALAPGGIVSIPVSIREFPAYAIRMLATVRAGLKLAGIADAGAHVLAYRSAWNVRILVSGTPFGAARIEAAQKFCDERSFDLSYAPGRDQAGHEIFNDLPPVNFEAGEVSSGGAAQDAIAGEAGHALAGEPVESGRAFDLSPITLDRPAFFSVLRLSHLGTLMTRLEILPQAEIGALVNLAVLAQAIVVALLVLAVPLASGVRLAPGGGGRLRPLLFFPALGLGFLFIEIFLIERASFFLNDRTAGFALVLTGMLVFSGVGSLLSGRLAPRPRLGMALAAGVVVAWGALLLAGLEPAMLAALGLPYWARAGLVLAVVAPVSVALGLPFPLGLARVGQGGFLPWAWGLNGAFSVVATPLANLVAREAGFDRVLLVAILLYVACLPTFPSPRKGH
jgi:hypothetical protein